MGILRRLLQFPKAKPRPTTPCGLAAWLVGRLRPTPQQSRLNLVERIQVAPRQFVALVEADGRRFLVGMSQDGAPTFLALEDPKPQRKRTPRPSLVARSS